MPSTQTLGEYFKAWKTNHEQSDADLAAGLRTTIDQLTALAAELVEVGEESTASAIEDQYPMPDPPLPGELLSITERHGVNHDRLLAVVNGRLITRGSLSS